MQIVLSELDVLEQAYVPAGQVKVIGLGHWAFENEELCDPSKPQITWLLIIV